MDDGSRAVARLPFTLAGPAKFTTASEVATVNYLQENTEVPIPKILDWSDDATNCVGSEYIIMEHVHGIQLQQKWPHMSGDEKVKCIDAIYRKLKDVAGIEFPAYGSLYFRNSLPGSFLTIPIQDKFCIGPHCSTRYWNCENGRSERQRASNHGPWSELSAFVDGLVDAGISRVPSADSQSSNRPSYHGSVQTHLGLLEHGRNFLKAMAVDGRVCNEAAPTLFHPDLHKRNIFVSEDDPSLITGIIDWQSSSTEPAFWYADETPDFAACPFSPGSSAHGENDSDLCAEAYEVCTQFLTPRLARPRSMNESLFRPFRYCYRTWKDGAVAFKHELIETSNDWEVLGLSGSCPISLRYLEDTKMHEREYQYFEAAQNLKRDLSNLLDSASDGWVPPDSWEAAKAGNRAMFSGMLQAVLDNKDPDEDEPVRTEEDLKRIWPFDLPEET